MKKDKFEIDSIFDFWVIVSPILVAVIPAIISEIMLIIK